MDGVSTSKFKLTRKEAAWLRWSALFQWRRVIGITTLSLAAYFLVFVVFGKTDISWLLPKAPLRFHWPDLPAFFVEKTPSVSGEVETLYTVPTRQLTPRELAQASAASRMEKPAPSK